MRETWRPPRDRRRWSRDALDRAATVSLSLLVVLSIVLSGLLWTGTPAPVNIGRTGFFSGPTQVSDKTARGLFRPLAIWIWTANNELFRLSGNAVAAGPIMRALRHSRLLQSQWRSGVRATGTLPPAGASLRLDFGAERLPSSLLSWIVPGLDAKLSGGVNGPVYITPTASKDVYGISYQIGRSVFHGTVASPSPALATAFTPTDTAIPFVQIPVNGHVYDLPYDTLTMSSQTWLLSSTSSSHIIDSFFSDPTSVISVEEGSHRGVLYTDGSVGVHVTNGPFGLTVHYAQASAPLRGWRGSTTESLSAAVPFINDHGGFLGDQTAVAGRSKAQPGRDVFTFRGLIGGWPLFGTLNQIRIATENGVVVSLRRALAQLDLSVGSQSETILSGPQLIARLGAKQLRQVQSISLGYGVNATGGGIVRLAPVYRLTMTGGSARYLNAVNARPFEGTGMTGWTSGG